MCLSRPASSGGCICSGPVPASSTEHLLMGGTAIIQSAVNNVLEKLEPLKTVYEGQNIDYDCLINTHEFVLGIVSQELLHVRERKPVGDDFTEACKGFFGALWDAIASRVPMTNEWVQANQLLMAHLIHAYSGLGFVYHPQGSRLLFPGDPEQIATVLAVRHARHLGQLAPLAFAHASAELEAVCIPAARTLLMSLSCLCRAVKLEKNGTESADDTDDADSESIVRERIAALRPRVFEICKKQLECIQRLASITADNPSSPDARSVSQQLALSMFTAVSRLDFADGVVQKCDVAMLAMRALMALIRRRAIDSLEVWALLKSIMSHSRLAPINIGTALTMALVDDQMRVFASTGSVEAAVSSAKSDVRLVLQSITGMTVVGQEFSREQFADAIACGSSSGSFAAGACRIDSVGFILLWHVAWGAARMVSDCGAMDRPLRGMMQQMVIRMLTLVILHMHMDVAARTPLLSCTVQQLVPPTVEPVRSAEDADLMQCLVIAMGVELVSHAAADVDALQGAALTDMCTLVEVINRVTEALYRCPAQTPAEKERGSMVTSVLSLVTDRFIVPVVASSGRLSQ